MPHQRFPKVEILYVASNELRFILSDTDVSMTNTLRRIMIGEVPTLAIDLVEFEENSTVLNDEYIAHRLGMIPLRFQDPNTLRGGDCTEQFLSHRECICYERCRRCSVEFDLDVEFDKENLNRPEAERMLPITVTSQDLKSNNELVRPGHFLNEEEQEEAHDEGISIVKIGPGQHLKMHAIARMGILKEHAKWCPVAVCTYKFWPEINFNHDLLAALTLDQKQELVDVCPDRILYLDETTGQLGAVENAHELATYTEDLKLLQQHMKKRAEDEDFVTVEHNMNKCIFSVESVGSMDAEDILMSSMKVLKERLNYLAAEMASFKDM